MPGVFFFARDLEGAQPGMNQQIEELRQQFVSDLAQARSLESYTAVRDKWLGREKGIITGVMKSLRDLTKQERPAFGQSTNRLRAFVEEQLSAALERIRLEAKSREIARSRVDVTRPGFPYGLGMEHPLKHLQ